MLPRNKISIKDDEGNIIYQIDGKYTFKQGETFNSYEDLQKRMDLHIEESLVYYWRRDSRTVERAFKKTSRPISSKLKYYLVRYACVYGGMKFQTRGVGHRASQSMRTNCLAHILFRASKCGQMLEVISVCNDHNHEISEKALQRLPQNRRLPKALKDEVFEMLRLKIDKKKIIEYVKNRGNKKITAKDLFNMSSRLKYNDHDFWKIEQEKRNITLQNIFRHTTEKQIKNIIKNELSAHELHPSVYFPVNSELEEYISPDHEFGVNETIIDSMVEARKREIDQWNKESKEIQVKNDEPICTEYSDDLKETIDSDEQEILDDIIIDESKLLESDEIEEDDHSTTVNYEKLISPEDCYYYSPGQFDGGEHCELYSEEPEENLESTEKKSERVVLFETTTDNNFIEKKMTDDSENVKFRSKKNTVAASVKKNLKRTSQCRKCGTNSRLLMMQIEYLRARKNKLLAETSVLVLKKKKLHRQIKWLKTEQF